MVKRKPTITKGGGAKKRARIKGARLGTNTGSTKGTDRGKR